MRRAWIVLFMIALLPVRGWALVTMTGAMPVVAATAVAATAAASRLAMPCHGTAPSADVGDAGSSGAQAAPEAATPSTTAATHLCQSCDLCHAPLAGAAPPRVPTVIAAADPVVAAPARDTGHRLAGRLERPPRA
jgi:hypothetical protein